MNHALLFPKVEVEIVVLIITISAQVRLRACQIAEFRAWQADLWQEIEHAGAFQRRGFRCRAVRVRSDGTQSNMFKKSKLQATEVQAVGFTRSIFSDTSVAELLGSLSSRRMMSDIVVARGTGTADGVVGMLQSQFKSVGTALWSGCVCLLVFHPCGFKLLNLP